MDQDLDILVNESRSRIASLLGRAEELKASTQHEQRMLDALCEVRKQLDQYKQKYDATSTHICPYIDIEGLLTTGIWQPHQFEDKLREACEQDSNSLATFLRENEKKGYLNFHGDSKTKVLETLRAHFPSMRRYSYNTFATYF